MRTTSPVPRTIAAYLAKVELWRLLRCDAWRERLAPSLKHALGSQGAHWADVYFGGCPGWPRGCRSGRVTPCYWPVGLMDKASAPEPEIPGSSPGRVILCAFMSDPRVPLTAAQHRDGHSCREQAQ